MNTKSYFIFNGKNSRDFGVYVERQPDIIRPARRMEAFTVPGRSGSFYMDENSFENTTKTAECAVLDRKYIDRICAWLVGAGDVIFSNEKDKYYKAVIKNQIPFSKVLWDAKRFPVQFDCQPFKYSVNKNRDKKQFTAAAVFYGDGNIDAAPVIMVYGNGDIDLTINGVIISLSGVSDYITIDSQIMDAYKDSESRNNKMNGEFPVLYPGENRISWTGSVSMVEIIPDWRWI